MYKNDDYILNQPRVLELLEIYRMMYKKSKRVYKIVLKVSGVLAFINIVSLIALSVVQSETVKLIGVICFTVYFISCCILLFLDSGRKKHLMRFKTLYRLIEKNENNYSYDVTPIMEKRQWVTWKCVMNSLKRHSLNIVTLFILSIANWIRF